MEAESNIKKAYAIERVSPRQQAWYAGWRLRYYIAAGNMTYKQIDGAVRRGFLVPGTMPSESPDESIGSPEEIETDLHRRHVEAKIGRRES